MEDGRISYVSELSEKGFADGANRIRQRMRDLTSHIEKDGSKIDEAFDKIGSRMKQAFAVSSIVAFEKKIIEVRSEMESLQKSFESLAGEHIGKQLYEDIKQFATSTPMMMKDLAKGAQTLLGFNIEAQKVMPILRQIGDISMGDAQKFNSLTLAFAQMSSTGKLMGQDLLQMINAGFNPLVVISEKTGKSVAKLKEEMSEGKITVEMVEDAFRTATSEGGKFNNMLETQSKTMKGALSNLQGAYEDMLNEIGEKQQGVMLDTVNLAQSLIKNYEKVGQVLLGLITTYGTYRAAVMAVSVAEGVANGQIVLKIRALRAAAAAQALLNKTMLANPYVLAATALGVLVGSIIAARDGLTNAERAQRDYNKTLEDAKQKQEEYNAETQQAISLAQDDSAATSDREGAMQTLISRYPEIIKKYIDEKGHLTDILNLKREIAAYDVQMANLDNKTRADMYAKYIQVLQKLRRGEQLNETEKIMYQGAEKKYNEATPWYNRFSANYTDGAIDYFQQLEKQANRAFERGKTSEKVAELMDKMGDMKTKELEKLKDAFTRNMSKIKQGQSVFVKELGVNLEASDYSDLATKAEGILNARSSKKKELSDKEKKAAEKKAAQEAKEAAAERQKLFEAQMKAEEEMAEMMRKSEDAIADAKIAGIKSSAERERAEREEQYRRTKRDLKMQEEDIFKTIYEQRKKEYEAKNKDSKYEATPEGMAGYTDLDARLAMIKSFTDKERKLYDENQKYYDAKNAEADANEERRLRENIRAEEKSNREAINSYLKQYGDYAEKKQAIYDDANAEICELEEQLGEETNEDARRAIEAKINTVKEGTNKQIDELDVQYGKAKAFMINLFEDVSDKSISEIDRIIKKYTALVEFLKKEGSVSRDDLKLLGFTDKEIDDAVNKVNREGTQAIKNVTDAIKALNKEAGNKNPWEQLKRHIGEIQKKLKETKEKGGDPTEYVGELTEVYGDAIQQASEQLEVFGEGIAKCFNVDTSSLEKSMKILKELGGIVQGVGQIAKKDYLGGAISIVGSLGSIVAELTDNSDRHKAVLEGLTHRIDVVNGSINRLSNTLEKSYGIAAQELAERIREKERNKQNTALEALMKTNLTAPPAIFGPSIPGYYAKLISDTYGLGISFGDDTDTSKHGWEYLLENIDDAERLAEIMHDIRENNDWLWHVLTGNEEAGQYFTALADSWESMVDSIDKEKERITGTTLEDVVSDMVDSLYELADGSEDATDKIAENWEKMMNRMVINNLLRTKLEGELKAWYEAWYEAFNGDKDISEDERQALKKQYDDIWDSYASEVNRLKDEGIINPISDATDKVKDNFNSIRDAWVNTIMEMKGDTESLGKEIARIMFESLVKSNVFNGDFDEWLKTWYADLEAALKIEDVAQREKRLAELQQQRTDKVEELTEATKEYADVTGYSAESVDELSNSLDNLSETLLDNLLDAETDAADIGKKIGQTLVREMLQEILTSEKYSKQTDSIKQLWQNVLSGGDKWTDEEGLFGEKGVVYTLETIIKLITELNNEIANDDAIDELTKKYQEWGKKVKDSASDAFTSMGGSFVSALMDMDGDLNDFANNLKKTIVQKMVEGFMVSEKIKPILDDLQNTFNYAMGLEGATPEQRAKLVAGGYTDENGEVHSGIGSVAKTLEPLKGIVKAMLEAIGYTVKKTGEEVDKSLSSIAGNMTNALMDGSKGAEDFAKNLKETIVNGLVEAYTATEDFQEGLKAVKDNLQAAIKSGDREAIEQAEKAAKAFFDSTAKAVEGYTDTLKDAEEETNKFAGIFEGMTDSWISNLMDFEGTVEGWSENVGRMITENILKQIIAPKMIKPMLDSLQEAFDQAVKDVTSVDGDIDWENLLVHEGLLAALEEMKESYPDLKDAVEKILAAFGITKKDDINEAAKAFDNLTSTIIDGLTDAEMTAEKFGANLAKTMTTDMMEAMLNKNYASEISDIQADWAKALTDGNDQAIEDIKKRIIQLYKDMGRDTEELRKVFEEIQQQTAELPFSGLRDAILSSLTDADMDAEKFGKKIALDLMNEMLETLFDKRFGDSIKRIREMWQSVLNGESTYTYEQVLKEIADLRESIMQPGTTYSAITDEIKELEKSLNGADEQAKEAFSGLGDKLVSSLMNADMTAEEFAKDIARTMVEQMLKQIVESQFAERMEDIQKRWAEALKNNDRDAIQSIKQDIVDLQNAVSEETRELTDSVKEIIEETDKTFSGMSDSWVSALMDMEKTAEDWAQDVGRIMAQRIIEQLIVPMYIQPLLDKVQETMDAALSVEGATWVSAVAAMQPLLAEITDAYAELQPITESILNSFGIYREVADEVQEAVEEVKYALDDMEGDFVSALMRMGDEAGDFGQDISKKMAEAFIRNFVLGDAFQLQKERWQQEFESILTGGMSEEERARQLKQLRDTIVAAEQGYEEQANAVKALFGLNTSDDARATMSGLDKLTAEQGDVIVGLGTSLVIGQNEGNALLSQILATLGGKADIAAYRTTEAGAGIVNGDQQDYAKQILVTLQGMAALTQPRSDTLDRMYPYVVASEGHLADIMRTNRDMLEQVIRVVSNTSNLKNL